MSASYLPNVMTPVTPTVFFNALNDAWTKMNAGLTPPQGPPTKAAVLTVMAQSALETGWWKYCHNFNFGNAKSSEEDGYDYTYFSCDEDFPIALAQKLLAASTPAAPCKITATYPKSNIATIWFYPEHPDCRFRAFTDINSGMADYLKMLVKHFGKAWAAALQGNPALFVQQLKAEGYFTASLGPYQQAVVEIFEELSKMPL